MLKKIKRIVARNYLLDYTYFIREFKIRTNAIYFQIVAVISQEYKILALHSIKLPDPQMRCTVTEKELLIIVENLKQF